MIEKLPANLKKVDVDLDDSFASYFVSRARQHVFDSYMGVPMLKMPESLRVYEHLLWSSAANVVVEVGCLHGGSALWFRDRLETMAKYRGESDFLVIAVDLNLDAARKAFDGLPSGGDDRIVLVDGDVRSDDVGPLVQVHLPSNGRCLVIEDSAHTYETTRRSLETFASLVSLGSFFVIEDGYLDGPVRDAFRPEELVYDGIEFGGMIRARNDWLNTPEGHKFQIRSDLEYYGLSPMPGGILQRRAT